QAAIQCVAPAVVVAAQAFGATTVAGRERAGAMATNVVQGAQRAIVAANQQQRHAGDVAYDVITAPGKLVGTRKQLPSMRENCAAVAFEAFVPRIEICGQRRGAFQWLRRGVTVVDGN